MEQFIQPKSLLTIDNAKTIKGEDYGYKTFILYMASERQNSFGKNLCPNASKGCASACLYTAGRGRFSNVQKARIARSDFFIRNRNSFMDMLCSEIYKAIKKHNSDKICIRLNGTSDIPYENIKIGNDKNIMSVFPDVQFYDYTKTAKRFFEPNMPTNYHLTFSRSESNDKECQMMYNFGHNVAVVFDYKTFPTQYMGKEVINGDLHDLRFLDKQGVIVGLKAKGDAKKDTSGFVIHL
jgi:hypothetical protein